MRVAVPIVVATGILTWASGAAPALQSRDSISPLESIRMIDAQTGWAVTARCGPCPPDVVSGRMLRTTDGGTQWKDVTPLDSWGRRIDVPYFYAFDANNAWVTRVSRDDTGEVFHTADGGRTWKGITIPGGAEVITFINPREGWLLAPLVGHAGRTDVDILRSTDGGETWIKVANNTTPVSGLTNISGMTGITFLDSRTGWITGLSILPEWFYLYVTHDGGHTWRQQNLPIPPQPQRNQPLSSKNLHWQASLWRLKFLTTQDGIMLADYSYYLLDGSTGVQDAGSVIVFCVTHDGGTTWTYTTPVSVRGNDQTRPSQFIDMNHGWVKEESTLYVTNDGGRTWTATHPDPLIADVTHLDFISPKAGWAVRNTEMHSGGARPTFPFLLKTLDGGRTWSPVTYAISRQ